MLYQLLRDCARLRYANEVVLGGGPRPEEDDIAIWGPA
jgi:hypothetical protein